MESPPILALIPARGGSKSIPRKNLAPLLGKPLLAYAVEVAMKSERIDRVIVSTDDSEIAEVARACGAEVPFLRPATLAQDETPDLPVFQHALRWLEAEEGWNPEIVVHLRPTSPLRRSSDVDACIDLLIRTGADAVRSISLADKHPRKMWHLEGERLKPLLPPRWKGDVPWNAPRQTLEKVYWQNAALDVIWRKTILEKESMTGDNICGYVMPPEFSIDIDSPVDLAMAEELLRNDLRLSEIRESHVKERGR